MSQPPTPPDILALADAIGVSLPQWLRHSQDWATLLHELAHWAVKPDGYLQTYRQHTRGYDGPLPCNSLPDADLALQWNRRPTVRWPDGDTQQLPTNYVAVQQLDPTPNEFGARAWGLQVIRQMGWPNPLASPDLQDKYISGIGTAQFDPTQLFSDTPHVVSRYGPDQLAFMGIDLAAGQWRPQVEVTLQDRWLRVYRHGASIWQLDLLQDAELIGWSDPVAPPNLLTLADIDALCARLDQDH